MNPQAAPGLFWTVGPIVIVFAIMFFLVVQPDLKRQKKHREMLAKLKRGDRVVTGGGLRGSVMAIQDKDNVVVLKVGEVRKEPMTIEVERQSISRVLEESAS